MFLNVYLVLSTSFPCSLIRTTRFWHLFTRCINLKKKVYDIYQCSLRKGFIKNSLSVGFLEWPNQYIKSSCIRFTTPQFSFLPTNNLNYSSSKFLGEEHISWGSKPATFHHPTGKHLWESEI